MPAKWLVSMTVLLGALMAVIDTSIVNVAMPHMAGGLGVGIDEITWVAISYMVANVIVMPLIYFFSPRFGRRR
jgi:DHA2 family multidrug resistance protein